MNYHKSVLLEEAITGMNVISGCKYIDATLGGGGHAKAILDRGGVVLGIDADKDAIDFVSSFLASEIDSNKLTLVKGNFANIDSLARNNGFDTVSGILFDLGVSSHQIDTPGRGFSYQNQGPLDMRMDKELQVSAMDLVNGLSKNELIRLFTKYAEENRAKRISEFIISAREEEPITTTQELVRILARAYGFNNLTEFGKAKSSQKVFQALRIAVNDELNSLELGIYKSLELLDKGGRLVVISFHSLEDRAVKHAFMRFESEGKAKIVTDKPVTPAQEEILKNKRSENAKLRILEKL